MNELHFINGQDLEPYRNIRYMRSRVGRAGCGPIAVYNLMLAMGDKPDIREILSYCERYRLLSADGLFGTNTLAMNAYLRRKGYRTKLKMFPKVKEAERYIDRCGGGIVNYFWGRGSHYVCAVPSGIAGGMYTVYNSSNRFPSERYVRSLRGLAGPGKPFVLWSVLVVAGR